MLFNFRHVVRDVVHLAQFVVFDLAYQNLVETLPYQVCQQLAIGEREVRGTRHGMEVCLALLRVEWRANQFAVRQCNPVILYGFLESAHVVFADLVAKTSGAAVNLHGNIAGENTEPGSNRLIVDFNNFVYFDEVVPGSQRPELVPPTLAGTIGNKRSIRSGQRLTAVGFYSASHSPTMWLWCSILQVQFQKTFYKKILIIMGLYIHFKV